MQLEQQQVLLQQLQDLQEDRCKELLLQPLDLQVLLQLVQPLGPPLPLLLQVPLQLVSSFLQPVVLQLLLLPVLLELLQALQLK